MEQSFTQCIQAYEGGSHWWQCKQKARFGRAYTELCCTYENMDWHIFILAENTPFPWVADTTTIHNLMPPPFHMPTDNELLNLISAHFEHKYHVLPWIWHDHSHLHQMCLQTSWQRVGECQCHGPPHCCSLQSAHRKGSHSQVLERGQADSHLQKRFSTNPRNYRMIAVTLVARCTDCILICCVLLFWSGVVSTV